MSEIQPWDSDHTALVHVLWAADREGLTIRDADGLASRIMRSEWMRAVRFHAASQSSPPQSLLVSTGSRCGDPGTTVEGPSCPGADVTVAASRRKRSS